MPENNSQYPAAFEVSLGDLKKGKTYIVVRRNNGTCPFGPAVYTARVGCGLLSFCPMGISTRSFHIEGKYMRFWEVTNENCEGRQFLNNSDFQKVPFHNLKINDEVHFVCGNQTLYGKVVSLYSFHGIVSHADGSKTKISWCWEFYGERK